jgi:hypothetical protein
MVRYRLTLRPISAAAPGLYVGKPFIRVVRAWSLFEAMERANHFYGAVTCINWRIAETSV